MSRSTMRLFAFMLAFVANAALGQGFPSRSITLVVPYSAGPTDTQYRKLAELAGKHLGRPVVVENKPGAGGTLGLSTMAKTARADGYTIGASTVPLLRVPHMQKVDWDPLRDFTWIIGLGGYTFVVTVREDSPFKSFAELIAWAKANPGKLNYGTPGTGTSIHLLMEEVASRLGLQLTHIPFKGGAETTTALLGGHVMATADVAGSVMGQVEAGKMRVLVTFDAERAPYLASVPTAKELGIDIVYSSPYGLVGPKDMPQDVVGILHNAFKLAMEDPENKALLGRIRQNPWYRGPRDYADWARSAYLQERAFVERAGLMLK